MNLPALAAALLAFTVAGSAHAFCRAVACNPDEGDVCTMENGCPAGGPPLFWKSSCVTFNVQRDGSPLHGIDAQAFENAIETAFQTWQNADCGGGTHPSITVTSLGEVECHIAQYSKSQGNANIYMFHDDEWVEDPFALAITTTRHDKETGEIYDADVEMNGTMDAITNTEPEDGADLLSILTHESGHFLGLAHSQGFGPTMQAVYTPKEENLRVLRQDDIDGICAALPPDRPVTTNDCTPRHGFSSTCHTEDSGEDSGCDCRATPARPSAGAAWLLLGVAGLGALSRRRRRAAS